MSEIDLLRELVHREIEDATRPLHEELATMRTALAVLTTEIAELRVTHDVSPTTEETVAEVEEEIEEVIEGEETEAVEETAEDESESVDEEVVEEAERIADRIDEVVEDVRPERSHWLHYDLFSAMRGNRG